MGKDCCGQRRYLRRAAAAGCGRSARQPQPFLSWTDSHLSGLTLCLDLKLSSKRSCKQTCKIEPILSFFNPSQLRSNLISSFGYLSSPKPRSGLTGLRWRIAAKKVHWHGHEILRRLRSFRKLRQPRGLKRFERRQFSLGIDWESDLVVMGGCFHG